MHPLAVGVTVKVTVTGALVLFVREPLILPEPLFAMPVTAGLSLVQLKTVPATLPLFTIVVMEEPLQMIVCAEGVATAFGVGFTSTVALIADPEQVAPAFVYDGVIVNVTVIGALVAFVSVPMILPEPLFAIPVTPGLSRVQV